MTERILPGDPDVRILLRRSRAARRFSLRVSQLDGRVTLTLPARAAEREALDFAAGQADWIRTALARAVPARSVGIGSEIPVEGRLLRVTPAALRAPRIEGAALLVPDDSARAGARVEAYLRLAARIRLQAACDRYAAEVGRGFNRITLRDTRSRWGSCAADGSLMFSWRLIMAPPEVLDYVAAHEVAHLVEMNHSADFWAVVARIMPGYAPHRRWIKGKGNELHRYVFRG